MNEKEISAIFDITADPVKNVYLTGTRESIEELQRIVRIFAIAKSQRGTFDRIKARGLVAFRMLVSNN